MTIYWPDYYKDFSCKRNDCRHTCCAGWEIGIDKDSIERFMKDPEIAGNIKDGGFVLREDGRCPFLRDDGLCEMIIKHGEDYLCDICKEHPRFYNEVDDHIEGGVGLVCEAACELILGREHGFELVSDCGSRIELPGYLKVIFDDTKPLTERLMGLSGGKKANSRLRAEIFNGMEVLDHKWTVLLKKLIDEPVSEEDEEKALLKYSKELTNFAGYLLYRYQGEGRFAAEATYLIADLAAKGCGIAEICRVFSGEVEYSDINIVEALEIFGSGQN